MDEKIALRLLTVAVEFRQAERQIDKRITGAAYDATCEMLHLTGVGISAFDIRYFTDNMLIGVDIPAPGSFDRKPWSDAMVARLMEKWGDRPLTQNEDKIPVEDLELNMVVVPEYGEPGGVVSAIWPTGRAFAIDLHDGTGRSFGRRIRRGEKIRVLKG